MTAQLVLSDAAVSYGRHSGHDRPEQEIITEVFQVDAPALRRSIYGRYGFASSFAYSSNEP